MIHSATRPQASPAQIGLAILAVLALTFSFFTLAQPVRADHVDGSTVQLNQDLGAGVDSSDPGEFAGSDEECANVEEGTVLFHFVANQLAEGTTVAGSSLTATFADHPDETVDGYSPSGDNDSPSTIHFDVVLSESATLTDASATFNIAQTEDTNLLLSHVCDKTDDEVSEDLTLVKQVNGAATAGIGFTLEGWSELFTDASGEILFEDLTEGDWTLTETTNPNEDCATGGSVTIHVSADGSITVTDDDETDGLVIVSFDTETNILVLNNICEADVDNGFVEIDKQFCDSDEGTRTEIEVNDPIEPGATAQSLEVPEDGCVGGVAHFTIYAADAEGNPVGDPVLTTSTDATGSVTFELPEGDYVIVEDSSGESAWFTVAGGMLTIIEVTNFVDDEENGFVEIDKQFCGSDEGTRTEIEVNDPIDVGGQRSAQAPQDGCEGGVAHFTIYAADAEGNPVGDPVLTTSTDATGSVTFELPEGDYVIVEDSSGESAWFTVEENMLTIIEVVNFESGLVKVLKHNCDGAEDAVLFSINGSEVTGFDPDTCVDGTGTFQIDDGDAFLVDGEAVVFATVGSHTLSELSPMTGTSPSFEVEFAAEGALTPITTIHVYNVSGPEGEVEADLDLIKTDLEASLLSGVEFTLTNGDTWVETTVAGTLTFEGLTEGTYSLTETGNPNPDCDTSGTITVMVDAEGAITVTDDDPMAGINIVSFVDNTLTIENDCQGEGGEENGWVKVLKHNCEGVEDAVLFSINGSAVTGFDPDSCVDGTGTFQIDDGDSFSVMGEAVVSASVGSHTLSELSPMTGTSGSFEVELAAEGELTPITTIHVYNVSGESEGGVSPGGGGNNGGNGNGGNGGVEGDVQGGQGGPGTLPDTATGQQDELPVGILALLLVAGLSGLGALNLQAVRRRIG